jgi:hypothetical protein
MSGKKKKAKKPAPTFASKATNSPEASPAPDPNATTLKQFEQLERESDSAYEGMLLWAMQTPDARNQRMLAKAIGVSEGSVRYWKANYGWANRIARVKDSEYAALHLFRDRLKQYVGTDRAEMLRAALDIVLSTAGYARLRSEVRKQRVGIEQEHPEDKSRATAYKSELTMVELDQIDPSKYMRDLAGRIRAKHLKEGDISKQIMLIDAVLGLIAKRIQTGELQVKVSDIPSLLKARALLTGLPTEQVAVHQQVEHSHNHNVVVDTVRMQKAKTTGDDQAVIEAMKEDVAELSVILGAIPKEANIFDAEIIEVMEG